MRLTCTTGLHSVCFPSVRFLCDCAGLFKSVPLIPKHSRANRCCHSENLQQPRLCVLLWLVLWMARHNQFRALAGAANSGLACFINTGVKNTGSASHCTAFAFALDVMCYAIFHMHSTTAMVLALLSLPGPPSGSCAS